MIEEAGRQRSGHIAALDGVRGLAILLVIPHNGNLMPAVAGHGPLYAIRELMLNGWIGVQLFFVLSGFLISGILLDTQRTPGYFRNFYSRRALRILPLYYAVLIVTFLVLAPLQWLPAPVLDESRHQIWLWTFLSNWTDPLGWDVQGFAHFWSLAVEEQFYLLWPLVLWRMQPANVIKVCIGICAVAFASRVAIRMAGLPDGFPYEFTICRMDALAVGAAAAAAIRLPLWQERIERWRAYLPWGALALLAVGAATTHDYARTGWATQTFGLTLLSIAFGSGVLSAAGMRSTHRGVLARILQSRLLRSAGKYSYGMYVFHFLLHKLIGVHLVGAEETLATPTSAILYATALTIVSYLCARLSFVLLERHFLALKSRFPRARPGTMEPT